MKKLPDRFICEYCGNISLSVYFICPACNNGKGVIYKLECTCGQGTTAICPVHQAKSL